MRIYINSIPTHTYINAQGTLCTSTHIPQPILLCRSVIHVIAAYMPYRTLHNGIENEYDSLVSLDS